jgi:DNA-binding winged helix-turn-helix (wHTH) protein
VRLRFGTCVFDSDSRTLTRDGAGVALTPKAFALLEQLIASAPTAVSKEALYQHLWPDTFVEQGNLHNLVSEIRTAIGDDEHAVIRTVHRFGYAFAAPATPAAPTRFAILLGDEEFPLGPGANVIGRDPNAAVVINAPDVSRHHARLNVIGGLITLEDLGSKNGTFVAGAPVTGPVKVTVHDEIAIGRTKIRLRELAVLTTTVTSV